MAKWGIAIGCAMALMSCKKADDDKHPAQASSPATTPTPSPQPTASPEPATPATPPYDPSGQQAEWAIKLKSGAAAQKNLEAFIRRTYPGTKYAQPNTWDMIDKKSCDWETFDVTETEGPARFKVLVTGTLREESGTPQGTLDAKYEVALVFYPAPSPPNTWTCDYRASQFTGADDPVGRLDPCFLPFQTCAGHKPTEAETASALDEVHRQRPEKNK